MTTAQQDIKSVFDAMAPRGEITLVRKGAGWWYPDTMADRAKLRSIEIDGQTQVFRDKTGGFTDAELNRVTEICSAAGFNVTTLGE